MYLSRAKDEHCEAIRTDNRCSDQRHRSDIPGSRTAARRILVAPAHWRLFCVVSIFFLAWEIEGFLMLAEKVCMDKVQNAVTIKLSASKTNRTLTTTRTWGCACAGDFLRPFPFLRGQRA